MIPFLDGKKTYIVAAGVVLGGVSGIMTGDLTVQESVNQILMGLGLGSLRLGVSKNGIGK